MTLQDIYEQQGFLVVSDIKELTPKQVTDVWNQGKDPLFKAVVIGPATMEDMHAQQRLAGVPPWSYTPEYKFYKVVAE